MKEELDRELIERLENLGMKGDYEAFLSFRNEIFKRVVIKECGEPMVSLSHYLFPGIFIKPVHLFVRAKDKKRLYLRRSVAEKLNQVQKNLPDGIHLVVRDAFRSERTVEALFKIYSSWWYPPNWFLSKARRKMRARASLALPDKITPRGHMTGGAVDVILADARGRFLQMERWRWFPPREEEKFTFSETVPEEAKKNRRLLYNAMIQVGFDNYFREYWHYSYGDAYWAARRKNKIGTYGIPPESLF
jgi:D-alanyl-D-alanine dipeptidase